MEADLATTVAMLSGAAEGSVPTLEASDDLHTYALVMARILQVVNTDESQVMILAV